MGNLLLDTLEIDDFRAFDHLRIEHLGRVNLIVGKNSVGKTSLLEALWLYASRADYPVLLHILQARDEQRADASGQQMALKESLRFLVHGHVPIAANASFIKVGSIGIKEYLFDVNGGELYRGDKIDRQPIPHMFVPAGGLEPDDVERLWDGIALTDLQDDVRKALRIIVPDVVDVNMIAHPGTGRQRSDHRIPMVRVEGLSLPVPLRHLGEGLNRLFGLILAIVNSRDGMLMVDEIESGLHYTAQVDLWKLIFATAKRLNVQVFATTHSWDCIEAFQAAACKDTESEGMLIRLDRKGETIVPVLYDEHKLSIAAHHEEAVQCRY